MDLCTSFHHTRTFRGLPAKVAAPMISLLHAMHLTRPEAYSKLSESYGGPSRGDSDVRFRASLGVVRSLHKGFTRNSSFKSPLVVLLNTCRFFNSARNATYILDFF